MATLPHAALHETILACVSPPGALARDAQAASATDMDRPMSVTAGPAGRDASPVPPAGFVLVVDDEPIVASELAAGLADMGYMAQHAFSAASAIEILASSPEITVLVTDVRMPGTDGVTFARAATAGRGADNALAVVLITGHATPEELASAMPGERVEVVRKPFRLKEIGAAVERAHRRASERRAGRNEGHP